MLTVKLIPNIFSKNDRKTVELECPENLSILSAVCAAGFDLEGNRVIVNGKKQTDLTKPVKNGDEIIVTSDIKDPITGILVAMGMSSALASWIGVAIAIAAVAYSIYSSVTASKRKPTFGTMLENNSGGFDESSPTYGWDGISLTQQVGTAIPVIYGEHRTAGNIINQYIRSDGEKQYLNVLIALSEGEIESIDNILINDNIITNFSGVTTAKRYGTNSQAFIPNFGDSHSIQTLNVNLTYDTPYVHTTTLTDMTAFEVQVKFPSGLYQQSGAGVSSWEVKYRVEYKLHTDSVYTDLGEQSVNTTSRSALYRYFRKTGLIAGKYDIRVTRTTADSTLDPARVGDSYLIGIDEINSYEPLAYPNVALLGVEALATDQLNGSMPNITSVVRGKKVSIPDIKNGGTSVPWSDYYWDQTAGQWKLFSDDTVLTWDGTTYIDAWSANPIWCMRDLLTNSIYGLGEHITTAMIDQAQMLEMAKYCDEKVSDGDSGYEKRFQLDVVIDSSSRAVDLIMQLCSTFRAFPFYSNGIIKLKIDKAETPVQLFGMGNIVENSFSESWKSIKEIPNVAEIQFLDRDKDYKQEMIAVIDEAALANGDTIQKKAVRLLCTRVSQCIREGNYLINVGKLINLTTQFRVGIDGVACQAGDVINVSHDLPQWGFSGRLIAGSTTTRLMLDQSVVIAAGKTYQVNVRLADDSQVLKTVTNVPGTYNYLDVSVAFSSAPPAYCVYAFGETNAVVKPFRIFSMKRASNNEVEITAMEYDEDIYDSDTIILPDENYSSLSSKAPDVTDLTLTEDVVVMRDGTVEDVIDVWFAKPVSSTNDLVNYSRARVYLSDNDGASWFFRGETFGDHFRISGGIIPGAYYLVAVVSVNNLGEPNAVEDSPQDEINPQGKAVKPADVQDFQISYLNNYITFTWDHIADRDLAGYEIRQLATEGAAWSTGTIVASSVRSNSHTMFYLPVIGTKYFAIKAIDTTGNYSQTEGTASLTITQGAGQGDIFVVDTNPQTGVLYLNRIANGEYGMILTCGGANQAPFWDWVYSAAGGMGAPIHNRFITLRSYNEREVIPMDKTIDKEVTPPTASNEDASQMDDSEDNETVSVQKAGDIVAMDNSSDKEVTPQTLNAITINYYTGTVAITNGTKILAGTSTAWTGKGLLNGHKIGFGSTDPLAITTWYTIDTVDSDAQITLVENFAESTLSGSAYVAVITT